MLCFYCSLRAYFKVQTESQLTTCGELGNLPLLAHHVTTPEPIEWQESGAELVQTLHSNFGEFRATHHRAAW